MRGKGTGIIMKDGTADTIISTATALFSQFGAFGTSLGEVAKQAGISKGTLYYYYPTKQALCEAVSEKCLSLISASLFAWVDTVKASDDPTDALGGLCDALLGEDMPLRVFIAVNDFSESGSELEASLDRAMNEWNVMIEVGSMRMKPVFAAKMKRMLAAVLPFLCGLAALNADPDYAREAFTALILG